MSAPSGPAAAAVRVPGFLPEDRFDAQPLWAPDRRTLFVCQARLDNRAELLGDLELPDLPLTNIADSTVLHAAYQRWGERVMEHLTGDYAFASFSFSTGSVFAAVDHIGHSRLYYAHGGGRIVLCTQLAALRDAQNDRPEWQELNDVALGLSVESQYLPGVTPFRNIRQLPGGECLTWREERADALQPRRWWQPETRPRARFRDPAQYVEAAGELFERAVSSCLRSAAPVAATLSGGLDSGLVTGTAARLLRERGGSLTAYTSAPAVGSKVHRRPRWDADDTPFAAQTAAFHGNIEHVIVRSDERTALDLMPLIHWRCATPVRNGANHLWLDAIACAAGPGVLLTGARGNFGPSYSGLGGFAELVRHFRWQEALHCAFDAQRAGAKPLWKTFARALLPPVAFESLRRLLYDEKHPSVVLTSASFRKLQHDAVHPRRPVQGTRAAFVRSMSQPDTVWAADPLPLWGMEWRDPTSDRRLLELLLSFPLAAFAHAGHPRGLAREMARNCMPGAVRFRRTRGEQAADYAVAMGRSLLQYRAVVGRMAASLSCRALFDLPALRIALDQIAAGEASPEVTSPIDRCIDAGLFFLETEGEMNQ